MFSKWGKQNPNCVALELVAVLVEEFTECVLSSDSSEELYMIRGFILG